MSPSTGTETFLLADGLVIAEELTGFHKLKECDLELRSKDQEARRDCCRGNVCASFLTLLTVWSPSQSLILFWLVGACTGEAS